MAKVKISDFLHRVKEAINVEDSQDYKRITIKINHQGVLLRDTEKGLKIGTKKQFKVSGGQFILSKIDAMNGAFGIVSKELDGAIITGNFWTFNFDSKLVNLEWFDLFTSSEEFVDICRRASSGTTHRKYLDEVKFNNYEIDLPSLNEQKIVVGKYKAVKPNIDLVGNEIEANMINLRLLKSSILLEAIQGKLVPQDPNDEPAEKLLERIKTEKEMLIKEGKIKKEKPLPPITSEDIPFSIPVGWKVERLGNLCKFIDYRGKTPTKVKTGVRLITAKNVKLGYLSLLPEEFMQPEDFDKWMTRGFPKDNDILFTTEAPLGNTCLYSFGREKVALAQRIITLHPLANLNSKYILYGLLSDKVRKQIFERQSGMTAKGVKSKKLKEIIIPIPPMDEQMRIVTKIELLMKLIDEQDKYLTVSKENIKNLNQSVLKELILH